MIIEKVCECVVPYMCAQPAHEAPRCFTCKGAVAVDDRTRAANLGMTRCELDELAQWLFNHPANTKEGWEKVRKEIARVEAKHYSGGE